MNIITSTSDFDALLKDPFEPKAILYSLKSDFFRNGNALCRSGLQQFAVDRDEEIQPYNTLPEFPCGERGCKIRFTTVHDYEVHFRSFHSLVCSECKKYFPSYNLLDIHIQEKHDSYHEAAMAKNLAAFECFLKGCYRSFPSSDQRDAHIIADHNFPSNFKYQNLKKPTLVPEENMMDVAQENVSSIESKTSTGARRKPYIPKNVCFGRGSAKTFAKVAKGKVSRDISMKELADAL